MRAVMICLAIDLLLSSNAVAAEPRPPSEVQIRQWIDELANVQKPRKYRTPDDRPTADERKSLEPVKRAYVNLSKHFVQSLPFLMEHLRDDRFSYPTEHPLSAVFSNRSVGAACRDLISRKVLLKSPTLLDHRGFPVAHELPIDEKWYARVKGMTLFEMQQDALDWIVAQPPIEGVSPIEWAKALESVRTFREQFITKGEAIDVVLSPTIEGK